MDFVTHSLVGAGAARLITPSRELRPAVTAAALGGSLIMDGDSWLHLLGPGMYGLYHRIVSHSIPGLIATALMSAVLAHVICARPRWRNFGWFVSPNLPEASSSADPPARAGFGLLLVAASVAAGLHWLGDVITGFGNMTPFWPLSRRDVSLHAVFSFDPVIFTSTIAWHLTVRNLELARRREAVITAAWFLWVTAYVIGRYNFSEPSYW